MNKFLKQLLLTALTVPTLAMAQNLDKTVAIVAGEPITALEVQSKIDTNLTVLAQQAAAAHQKLKLTKAQENEIQQGAFSEIIENRLMMNRAKTTGINIANTDVDNALSNIAQSKNLSVEAFKKELGDKNWNVLNQDLRTDMTKDALIKRDVEAKVQVSGTEIDAFLAEKKLGAGNPIPSKKGVEASHVYIDGTTAASKKKILAVKARLDKGDDFATVATEMSEYPTKANGGKIPVIMFGDADPKVVAAVDKLADGGMSDIVESKNGFHIFKVAKHIDVEFGLDQQKEMAKQAITNQKMEAAYKAWYEELMSSGKALVEIKQ